MQLQEVATCARRQDLALRLFVPDRCEQSACVPRHAEQVVFHGPPRNRDGFDLRSGRFVDPLLFVHDPAKGSAVSKKRAEAKRRLEAAESRWIAANEQYEREMSDMATAGE